MIKSNKILKKINKKIYLDYASSINPNPSSIHNLGIQIKNKLEKARKDAKKVLHVSNGEIIFTSNGTESNNIAIQGIVFNFLKYFAKPHIITTNIEHPSVLDTFYLLKERGLVEITIVEVEENGIVDIKKIKKEIKENTVLISVMYANNEIGTIQPIREIAKEIRHFKKNKKENKYNIPFFHSDAVQAVNYLNLNVENLGVDLLTLSGSKIENSQKVGLLYKNRNVSLAKILGGGEQEFGFRPGTQDVNGIEKFVKALIYTQTLKEKENQRLMKLRDGFILKLKKISQNILSADRQIIFNGDLENRLSNNVNITIPNIPSDLLVLELDAKGIFVSSKSACKQGDGKASHVISAINRNIKDTDGSIRFSFGRDTKKSDLDYTLKVFENILKKLKKWYN